MKRILLILPMIPFPVYAEVSDKMVTQPGLWASGLLVGAVLAAGIRWSKWLNVIGWPLSALFFYFAYDTLAQPDIGPAIIKEQGIPYIVALYGSAALVLLGVLVGNYLFWVNKAHHA